MSGGPWSVTDKETLAPSGDPRDYVSLAPYYWPDPSKPNGLPYINRYGQVNPETRSGDYSDRNRLEEMFTAVRTLNIAAYMTGNAKYSRRSAQLLQVFFLDERTGMNANLNFAQGIRGGVGGRSFGIIDLNSVLDVMDSIKLLERVAGPDVWTESDGRKFRAWCTEFLQWLLTSKPGREEEKAANNHGAWFDATAGSFADFLDDREHAKKFVQSSRKRIEKQINADGTLPLELARTRGWHYTIFALDAFAITAQHGARVGEDLWHDRPEDPT